MFQGLLVNGGYKNNQQMKFKDSSGASVKKVSSGFGLCSLRWHVACKLYGEEHFKGSDEGIDQCDALSHCLKNPVKKHFRRLSGMRTAFWKMVKQALQQEKGSCKDTWPHSIALD